MRNFAEISTNPQHNGAKVEASNLAKLKPTFRASERKGSVYLGYAERSRKCWKSRITVQVSAETKLV